MARRSGGGRSARPAPRPAPRPATSSSSNSKPANRSAPAPAPAPAQNGSGGSMFGSVGQAITDGMSWGAGNAMGHRIMDGIFGPRTVQVQHVTDTPQAAAPAATSTSMAGSDACGMHAKAFQDCVNSNGSDISRCQFYVDMLNECKRNSGSMSSY